MLLRIKFKSTLMFSCNIVSNIVQRIQYILMVCSIHAYRSKSALVVLLYLLLWTYAMKQTDNNVTFLVSYKSRFNLNCWQRFCRTAKMLNGSGLQRFREERKVRAQYGRHNIEAVDGARVANETWRLNRHRRVASGSCAWDSASSVNKRISRYLSEYWLNI